MISNFPKYLILGISLYSDCRFQCDKNGTVGGVCEKEDGYCRCEDGFYGDKCDKGKRWLKEKAKIFHF